MGVGVGVKVGVGMEMSGWAQEPAASQAGGGEPLINGSQELQNQTWILKQTPGNGRK